MLKLELNKQDLKKAIIKMIAFFDLFDSPLTVYEIYHNFGHQFSLSSLLINLDNLISDDQSIIQSSQGFYFLKGRIEIIKIRQKRYHYFYRKLKIAQAFTFLFKFFPSVEMIALANVMGAYNLRDQGDIDFFIITKEHRLWLTRFYCAGLAKLLHSRPTQQNKQDKICLSFYLSIKNLNLNSLHLKPTDPYFDYWPSQLVLLYNKHRTYQLFQVANNLVFSENQNNNYSSDFLINNSNFNSNNSLLNYLDNIFKKIQWLIMPSILKQAANHQAGVVIKPGILKFYLRDRRREFVQKYEQKIKTIFS